MLLKHTRLDAVPIIYMIVHLESGLWQTRKALIAELGGNSKVGIGRAVGKR